MPAEKIQPDSAHCVEGRKGFVCSAAGRCEPRTQAGAERIADDQDTGESAGWHRGNQYSV